MQKHAATKESNDSDTRTAFVSTMSDLFLKKIMIKRNTLIIVTLKNIPSYIKKIIQTKFWKQDWEHSLFVFQLGDFS